MGALLVLIFQPRTTRHNVPSVGLKRDIRFIGLAFGVVKDNPLQAAFDKWKVARPLINMESCSGASYRPGVPTDLAIVQVSRDVPRPNRHAQ